ncbi:hypothetical protein CYMTET_24302, partial [Cymbomonas tetramitiformis]
MQQSKEEAEARRNLGIQDKPDDQQVQKIQDAMDVSNHTGSNEQIHRMVDSMPTDDFLLACVPFPCLARSISRFRWHNLPRSAAPPVETLRLQREQWERRVPRPGTPTMAASMSPAKPSTCGLLLSPRRADCGGRWVKGRRWGGVCMCSVVAGSWQVGERTALGGVCMCSVVAGSWQVGERTCWGGVHVQCGGRWVNYTQTEIRQEYEEPGRKVKNFGSSFQDGEVYGTLLTKLVPDSSFAAHFTKTRDPGRRNFLCLQMARQLNPPCEGFITESHILNNDESINAAFIARIFSTQSHILLQ